MLGTSYKNFNLNKHVKHAKAHKHPQARFKEKLMNLLDVLGRLTSKHFQNLDTASNTIIDHFRTLKPYDIPVRI